MFRRMGRSIGSTMAKSIRVLVEGQNTALPVIGQYIPALDGLRGTAILLVVMHHLAQSVEYEFGFRNPVQRAAVFGWTGVELFFALSGYLATGGLYDRKGSEYYLRNFHARRALRLFPLYYGALLFALLLRAVWPQAGIYGTENPAWLWVYLTNFVIAWKGAGAFGFLDHFWWLAVEQHFYLLWPLIRDRGRSC